MDSIWDSTDSTKTGRLLGSPSGNEAPKYNGRRIRSHTMTEAFSFPTVFIKLSTVYYLNMLWWTFEVAKMFFRITSVEPGKFICAYNKMTRECVN